MMSIDNIEFDRVKSDEARYARGDQLLVWGILLLSVLSCTTATTLALNLNKLAEVFTITN